MAVAPSLAPGRVADLSRELLEARANARALAPLSERVDLSIADAYAIARHGVAADLAAGARVVGHKIGLTAEAVQRQLGVDTPDYGTLLDTMEIPDGATIAAGDYLAARVELELAFRLAEPLAGPGIDAESARAAVATVQPAIELVDSRIADWRITLVDTVADRASSAGFILGGPLRRLDEVDLGAVEVALERNGETVEQGRSDAVLGDPCRALAWLANALADHGEQLLPGQVILSGACTRMVSIAAGDRFRARFAGFDDLTLAVS